MPANDPLRNFRYRLEIDGIVQAGFSEVAGLKGNLTLEEQRLIENSLTELRFRFVQASQNTASASAESRMIVTAQRRMGSYFSMRSR